MSDRCDHTISEQGRDVFVTGIGPAEAIERWVKSIARLSGQPVDWGYSSGIAHVMAMGDLARVKQAIRETMGDHDALWRENYNHYLKEYPDYACPYRPKWWTSRDEARYGDNR